VDPDIIFPADGGINYSYGYLYYYYSTTWLVSWYTSSPVVLSGTSYFNLGGPTLDTYKNGVQPFQLAWEGGNSIYYKTLTDNSNHINHIQEGSAGNISSGSGFTYNKKPSIAALNGNARICWSGYNYTGNKETVTRTSSSSVFDHFYVSGNAINQNINTTSYASNYAIVWSEDNGNCYTRLNTSSIKNLSLSNNGYVQVSNGSTPGGMTATALNSSSSPYVFNRTSVGGLYGLSKSGSDSDEIISRAGVVYKDSAEFYFSLGNLNADGQKIDFVDAADTLNFSDITQLNKYLETQPFTLNDNSDFTYSVQYGITDSASVMSILKGNDFVSFKVELVDKSSGQTLSEFNSIIFNKKQIEGYSTDKFKVDTKGIGNKTVRLRLVVESNFDVTPALTRGLTGAGTELAKQNIKTISYKDNAIVKDYSLEQNYPNPFNPTTVIKYQIPKDGHVTLKIFDVLGREVATLIDGFKSQGRYNVTFNAGNLASGVYIYQLRADDFVANKKLILMK